MKMRVCQNCPHLHYSRFAVSVKRNMNVKHQFSIFQSRMVRILLRKNTVLGGHLPINAKVWVIPCNSAFALWCIVVVALVLKNGIIALHCKSMCKTTCDEKLMMVLSRKNRCHMLAKRRAALSDVNSHIQHRALHHTHQLCLCEGRFLEMQTTHYASAGE